MNQRCNVSSAKTTVHRGSQVDRGSLMGQMCGSCVKGHVDTITRSPFPTSPFPLSSTRSTSPFPLPSTPGSRSQCRRWRNLLGHQGNKADWPGRFSPSQVRQSPGCKSRLCLCQSQRGSSNRFCALVSDVFPSPCSNLPEMGVDVDPSLG